MTDKLLEVQWANDDPERQIADLNRPFKDISPDWLIDKKGNKWKVSRGIIFIITMILLLGLIATGIAKSVIMSSSEGTSLLSIEKPIQSDCKGPIRRNLIVGSATDLKELTPEQDTIIIETLNEDDIETYYFIINENQNVKNLKIDGLISIKWLRFLLQRFPAITTLDIDLDKLCPADMTDMDGFNFKSVENVSLTNLFRCKDIEWINNCQFPRIKSLEIRNADVTEKRFKSIHTFLNKNRKSVKEISERNCFICENCTFLDITYGKLNVTISGTRETPKF